MRVLIEENAELKRRAQTQKQEFDKEKTKMSLKIRMLWGDLYNARTEHKVTKYKLEKAKNEKGKLRDELNQFKSNRSRETKLLEDEVKSPKKQLHVYRPPSGTK